MHKIRLRNIKTGTCLDFRVTEGKVPRATMVGITYCYQRHNSVQFQVHIFPPRACRKQEMHVRHKMNTLKRRNPVNFSLQNEKNYAKN